MVLYGQQFGNNDSTFNVFDNEIGLGEGPDNQILSSCVQSDGKIIIVGSFSKYNETPANRIVRLNQDGYVDTSFHIGSGLNNTAYYVNIQSDGKIIVSGSFYAYNGIVRSWMTRIHPNGIIDTTFKLTGTGLNTYPSKFLELPDGKLLICGGFSTYNGAPVGRIIRLFPDGSIDTMFNTSGSGANGSVTNMALQPDGKIMVAGYFTSFNGSAYSRILRLNSDGTIDNSFDVGTGANNGIQSMLLQPDGKVILGGPFTQFNSVNLNHLVRLNTDGTIDNSFSIGSGTNNTTITGIFPLQNNTFLITGNFTTYNGNTSARMLVVDQNGTFDSGFLNTQLYRENSMDKIDYVSEQPNGNLLVSFSTLVISNYINKRTFERYYPNWNVDASFNKNRGVSTWVSKSVVQPDGKILIGGAFKYYNGHIARGIARLNVDGSFDTTFNTGMGANEVVKTIALQSDGKILIGGNFTTYNGVNCGGITRLNTDGSIDGSFAIGTGSNGWIEKIVIQPDGKILHCGNGGQFNGVVVSGIRRLNSNGTIDNTFSTTTSGSIMNLILQPDGKILYSNLDAGPGTTNYIYRLNSDGSPDWSFTAGMGANNVIRTIAVHPSGKILVGGDFGSYRSVACSGFMVVNSDGSVDSIFVQTNPIIGVTYSISVQPDEKILVGGNNLSRIYLNGTSDTSFNHWIGGYGEVQSLSFTNDGHAIVCGGFTSYLSMIRHRITKLNLCGPTQTTQTVTACDSYTINGNTYTVSGVYTEVIPNGMSGCDSTITLNLTIIPTQLLTIQSSFATPSDVNNCNGALAITISGNTDFELNLDNGSQVITSTGQSVIDNLCPGIHDIFVADFCGDTLISQIVIPVDSNYIINNPFIDSVVIDSLGTVIIDCNLNYSTIDTAYIEETWISGSDTVYVVWNIIDANGLHADTTYFVVNFANGVYWLQLSAFCPNKSVGEYFTVTEAIYFNNGSVSTAGLADYKQALFEVYPNPTNNRVQINFSGSEAELTVYDLQGKVVLKDQIQNQETISLEHFERGVYLFNFKNSQGQSVQRVVKQ